MLNVSKAEGDPVARFVLEMARALHKFGCPAHRLEEVMRDLSQHLGTDGNFMSTPTSIMASFGPPEVARTHLIRVEPGVVNLAGQVELDRIITDVLANRCTPEEGVRRIHEVEAAPKRYSLPVTILAGGVVSGAAAILFGGNYWDLGLAVIIGAIIGGLSRIADHFENFRRVYEAVGAFLAMSIAMLVGIGLGRTSVAVDVLAGVLLLLPGFSLTVSMQELATRNLAAGTARLMGTVVILFQLGFGVAVAGKLLAQLGTPPAITGAALPGWVHLLAMMVAALGFMPILSVPPRDALWVLAAAVVALAGARWGATILGPELGAFAGALALGIGSNLRARIFHRTAALTLVPGVLLLVPGSIGLRSSMAAFVDGDVVNALQTGFSMVTIGISLVAGLLFANLLVAPRRAL